MIRSTIRKSLPVSALLFVSLCLLPGAGRADICSEGIAEPPFLAYGVDPNLLIIIDNSASMYDLGYIGTQGSCYDDGYASGTNYAGYFTADTWYVYDFTDNRFEPQTTSAVAKEVCTAADGTEYNNDGGTDDVCITIDTTTDPDTVNAFAAKGNFLNWAAASKFDIQKKILTGGKYVTEASYSNWSDNSEGGGTFDYEKFLTLYDTIKNDGWTLTYDFCPADDSNDYIGIEGDSNGCIGGIGFDCTNGCKCYNPAGWVPDVADHQGFRLDNSGWSGIWTCDDTITFSTYLSNQLIMEARGCGGTRFVKKLALDDGKYLTLAVKPRRSTDHTTQIEIFQVNDTGFDNTYCQAALDEMASDSPTLGQIKSKIEACMEYDHSPAASYVTGEHPAFNQAIQTCWWESKHGSWPEDGAQHVTSLKNHCSHIYETIDPEDIATDSPGYVCYGKYGAAEGSDGYVGRCWEPAGGGEERVCTDRPCEPDHSEGDEWKETGTNYKCEGGVVKECTDKHGNDCIVWTTVQDCEGGGDIGEDGWTDDLDVDDLDDDGDTTEPVIDMCVDQALRDFCGVVQIPQVTDPSDLESSTGEIWNIPAMLIDSGVIGQLDQPIATLYGYIYEPTPPEGLIQEFATDLRMGVMRFNAEGSESECDLLDPHVLYTCLDLGDDNKDGGIVIEDIDQNEDHTDNLVIAINKMEADTWTPLAEAMYNAIGYYGQNVLFQLNVADFTIDAGVDPVKYWCQDNHVLIITEGASTADLNEKVATDAKDYDDDDDDSPAPCFDSDADGDVDADDISACNALSAGTYLDDMTYFGQHGAVIDIFSTPTLDDRDKQNIKTHIVATGTLRDTGDTECSPDVLMPEAAANGGTTLYTGDDAAALEANLRQVFSEIRAGASAGSAASVISSSRGGEGAIYQAIFWPSVDVADSDPIEWTGEVHALHIDSTGYLYEDTIPGGETAGDRVLNTDEDNRVIIYFDTDAGKSKACYANLVDGVCPDGSSKEIDEIQYLWSANDWLAKVSHPSAAYTPYNITDIFHNRSTYISNERRRYIFTWIDLNNNGIVDTNEVLPFEDRDDSDTAVDWENMVVSGGRGAVHKDFNAADNAEVNQIVRWVRGFEDTDDTDPTDALDDTGLRSRQLQIDLDKDGNKDDTVTWRLGDVIHSTPMVVTRPSEGYHLLYRDLSYAAFLKQYKNRRHVIYFGGNDGMLHAVNGGFYSNSEKKFCLTSDCDESDLTAALELGAELWAYVPTNLLPHLKCLTEPEYSHKYFVDLRPRIFDVRIFEEEDYSGIGGEAACGTAGGTWDEENEECLADHPGGWGTILVGGMRLGGAKELAADLNGDAGDTREFTSSYFIFDITNPENAPTLLGELTRNTTEDCFGADNYANEADCVAANGTWEDGACSGADNYDNQADCLAANGTWQDTEVDLGYTTAIPTMVVMNKGDDADDYDTNADDGYYYKWYLVFGNGPRGANGLDGQSDQTPRISILPLSWLISDPTAGDTRTAFRLPSAMPSAGGDWPEGGTFVLDDSGNGFVSDPITVDFYLKSDYMSDAVYFGTIEGSPASWSGRMYRLVTRYEEDNVQLVTTPSQWYGLIDPVFDYYSNFEGDADPENPVTLLDAAQPITASPTVGTDGNNFWVYFGTGRFFNADDKSDSSQQTYYGIKEPMDSNKDFTWDTVENEDSGADTTVYGFTPGDQGLLRVDQILVQNNTANLSCIDDETSACLPGGVTTLSKLVTYIGGTDGWYKNFLSDRERNLGQAALLGGLLTFTTYQPYQDLCQSEGLAFLYGVYYLTGTAWNKSIFGDEGLDTSDEENVLVLDMLALGRGLATTPNLFVGKDNGEGGGGPRTFVQTSTGEIKEIPQTNLPISNYKSGRTTWRELIP
ncbi:MAG: hypothetical protein U9O82_11900 [Thermodesulfobacteriota bacterium]|nr:hypothetical protein [Thermodesulfobacteriota bacterium]